MASNDVENDVPEVEDRQGLLDFLVTQEQFVVAALKAAIERAPGTPSEAFLPVLRNAITTEYHHAVALENVGGKALTTSFWVPDAAFGGGGVDLFATLEAIETIEVSMYGVGVNAFSATGDADLARLCAQAMATEAVHRALVRFAQGQLGKDVGVPNDVGFENFDWPSIAAVRGALEGLGVGYGAQGLGPGRYYEYTGDPVAEGVGTAVRQTKPT